MDRYYNSSVFCVQAEAGVTKAATLPGVVGGLKKGKFPYVIMTE